MQENEGSITNVLGKRSADYNDNEQASSKRLHTGEDDCKGSSNSLPDEDGVGGDASGGESGTFTREVRDSFSADESDAVNQGIADSYLQDPALASNVVHKLDSNTEDDSKTDPSTTAPDNNTVVCGAADSIAANDDVTTTEIAAVEAVAEFRDSAASSSLLATQDSITLVLNAGSLAKAENTSHESALPERLSETSIAVKSLPFSDFVQDLQSADASNPDDEQKISQSLTLDRSTDAVLETSVQNTHSTNAEPIQSRNTSDSAIENTVQPTVASKSNATGANRVSYPETAQASSEHMSLGSNHAIGDNIVSVVDTARCHSQSATVSAYRSASENISDGSEAAVMVDSAMNASNYQPASTSCYMISGSLPAESDVNKNSNLQISADPCPVATGFTGSERRDVVDPESILPQYRQVGDIAGHERSGVNSFADSMMSINHSASKRPEHHMNVASTNDSPNLLTIDETADAVIAHAAAQAAAAADAAGVVVAPGASCERPRPFPCLICGRSFLRTGDLNRHKATVHEKIRKAKCHICGGTYGHRGDLNRHITRVHDKGEFRQCATCGATFQSKAAYSAHQKIHAKRAQSGTPFPCEHCRKSFPSESERDLHCTQTHSALKVKCERDGCQEAFPSTRSLKAHIQARHTTIAHCVHCSATFRLTTELTEHISKRHSETESAANRP